MPAAKTAENVPYFAMYTDAGNRAVHRLFNRAVREHWEWSMVLCMLSKLADRTGCEEAYDTAVREELFHKLQDTVSGWAERNRKFYL